MIEVACQLVGITFIDLALQVVPPFVGFVIVERIAATKAHAVVGSVEIVTQTFADVQEV